MKPSTWFVLGAAGLLPFGVYADPCSHRVDLAAIATRTFLSGQVDSFLVSTVGDGLVFALGGAAALVGLPVLLAGLGLALITMPSRWLDWTR